MTNHTIERLELPSVCLKSSWLKTETLREIYIYLPPGYDERRKYPVAYVLSGWGSDGSHLLHSSNVFSKSLPDLFSESIQKQALAPLIAVFPSTRTALGGSQYINSPATGNFMDFICDELVPVVDAKYATRTNSDMRGVLGHSSGGYGALALGAFRPDTFGRICASAADSYFEYLYTSLIPQAVSCFRKNGSVDKFVDRYLSLPHPMGLLSRQESETMMLINMCACYLPDEASPTRGKIYFDPNTGEIDRASFEQLLAWDPVNLIKKRQDSVRKLSWIHLQVGQDDEYGFALGHRQISKALNDLNIPHLSEEYPGGHSGHGYRYVDRLQKMFAEI